MPEYIRISVVLKEDAFATCTEEGYLVSLQLRISGREKDEKLATTFVLPQKADPFQVRELVMALKKDKPVELVATIQKKKGKLKAEFVRIDRFDYPLKKLLPLVP